MLEILIVLFAIARFFFTILFWAIIKGGTRKPDEWIYPTKFADEMEFDLMMDESGQLNIYTHFDKQCTGKNYKNPEIVQ
jgi:hypothetical protein